MTNRAASSELAVSDVVAGFLGSVKHRIRLAWVVRWLSRTIPLLSLICAVVAVAVWFRFAPSLVAFAGLASALIIVGVVGRGLTKRVSALTSALAADRGLPTHDVFSSALQFWTLDDQFGDGIRMRANELATERRPKEAVAIRSPWWPWIVCALMLGVIAGSFLVEGPSVRARTKAANDRKALLGESKRLRAEAARLRSLGPSAKAAAQELDRAATELVQSRDRLAAADAMRQAAQSLEASAATRLSARAAARGLEQELRSKPLGSGTDAASQLDGLRDQLGQNKLSGAEAAATAQRLRELAQAERAGNPGLARSLDKAADNMQRGKVPPAQKALANAAAQQRQANQDAQTGSQSSAAARQLGQSSNALATPPANPSPGQSGQQGQSGQPGQQGQSGQSGESGQSGQQEPRQGGAQPGQQGQSGQQGRGQAQGQGDQPGLGGGGGKGPSAGRGSNITTGKTKGTLAPTKSDVLLPNDAAEATPGAQVGVGNAASAASGVRVPLAAAVQQSTERAASALNETNLAPSEERVVRSYFESLNTPNTPNKPDNRTDTESTNTTPK
jgi:hypothetical protein